MRFFFYGTLLDATWRASCWTPAAAAAYVPAALPAHARRRVKGASYPIAVRDPRSEVGARSSAA
jgi:hypothetical protein